MTKLTNFFFTFTLYQGSHISSYENKKNLKSILSLIKKKKKNLNTKKKKKKKKKITIN